MKKKQHNASPLSSKPLLKMRHLLAGVAVVGAVIAGPLMAVWKQVYTRSASINREVLADSLAVRNREIARLKLAAEKLSSNERIEYVARTNLGLEYPAYEQITVLRRSEDTRAGVLDGWEFIAILKRSFSKDRG